MTYQIPENNVRLKPFGIYGGGQLGYMLAESARRTGLEVVLYCQKPDEPTVSIADQIIFGPWDCKMSLREFVKTGIIGLAGEFEQADPDGVDYLTSLGVQTYTMAEVLRIGRDRLLEKRVANDLGIPTANHIEFEVGNMDHLPTIAFDLGVELIVKTRTLGYDGKDQTTLPNMAAVLTHDWKADVPYIIEQKVDFAYECSVQVTRTPDGNTFVSRAVRNKHTNRYGGGMLEHTVWFEGIIDPAVELKAKKYAKRLAERLGLVGVITAEFFVTRDGKVIFNEFAPRPHNSFHAREASMGNQFDLYIASLVGKTIVPIVYDRPFIMVNLVGDQIYLDNELRALGFAVVDYRKTESKPGRKMGHATLVVQSKEELRRIILELAELGLIEHLFTICS